MAAEIPTPPTTDYVHRQWAARVGAQNGITTSHMVAGVLLGANGYLRSSPAWRNLQGKVVGGIAAVALTYLVSATATRESVIRSHQHSRDNAKADTQYV